MEEKLLCELNGDRFFGVTNDLFVYESKLVVRIKYNPGIFLTVITLGILNFAGRFLSGDKTIYFTDINSVFVKKSGNSGGLLIITIPGINYSGGNSASLYFKKEKKEKAVETANLIDGLISRIKKGTVSNAADELKKYKALLDDGAITAEEFEKEKKKLLG